MTELIESPASVAPLGSALKMTLDNYETFKGVVTKNKTLGPRVSPLFDFTESTSKKVLDASPIKLETVVDAVDTRVDAAVTYGSETVQAMREAPGKMKKKSLDAVHDKLNAIKVDADEEPSEVGVATIADDVKVITSESLCKLLDASEGYMVQYLPISEEDKEEIKVEAPKGEFAPLGTRSMKQSSVAAKRVKELVMARVSGLQARTSEVIHVDLLKYSEFLDKQKNTVSSKLSGAYEVVDEKALQPVKAAADKGVLAVQTRVIAPARQRLSTVRFPFQDRFVKIWSVVGEEYESKVVQPRAQMVKMFREELAMQQELEREKSGSNPGDDLTITAGLKAVVAAASARLSKEMDARVFPTVNKLLGRAPPAEAEEKYDDEEDSE